MIACAATHIQEAVTRLESQSIDTVQCGSVQLSDALWCASPEAREPQWWEEERHIGFLQAVAVRHDQNFPCQRCQRALRHFQKNSKMNLPAIVYYHPPPQADAIVFFALRQPPIGGITVQSQTMRKGHRTTTTDSVPCHREDRPPCKINKGSTDGRQSRCRELLVESSHSHIDGVSNIWLRMTGKFWRVLPVDQ